MSRTVTRKFCDRDMGAHELATVYVEDDGRVVKVREAQATKNGMTPMWRPYTEADLADFAGMTVTAMCPCGRRGTGARKGHPAAPRPARVPHRRTVRPASAQRIA
jgi:hypothetical protein